MKTQLGLTEYLICLLINGKSKLLQYRQHQKSRHDLLKLNSDLLRDIGITKEEAKKEANRPFWEGRDSRLVSIRYSKRKRFLSTKRVFAKF